MKLAITDEQGRVYWTREQAAQYCGISVGTFGSYVAREIAPAPATYISTRIPLWDAEEVQAWHASRPSQRAKRR